MKGTLIGVGTMGPGIAATLARGGLEVTCFDVSAEQLRKAEGEMRALQVKVAFEADLARALAGADLVVEAVPEDPELKLSALQSVERQLAPTAWLATNTSSLPITLLASGLERPERFIGLHFFNPVPVSELLEVVTGERTSPELVGLATQWAAGLGKTPVVVRDSPGFASSRLGVALALEAIRMLEEGVASAADIDTAMVLGYKHPVGPLRLTDIVGLDVRLRIAEHLEKTLGDRFAPPNLLRELVARGDLGRKTGRGFFDWKDQQR